jgi:hypothetical protein
MSQQNDNTGCLQIITAVMVIAAIAIFAKYSSCNDKQVTTTPTNNSEQKITLTKEDTLVLKKSFILLGKALDEINTPTVKAQKQFQHFCNLWGYGEVTDYEVYETAKVAKNTLENAIDEMQQINPPDKLPDSLQENFNTAISEITEFYQTKADAFGEVMDDIDNGKISYKKADNMIESVNEATSDYNDGLERLVVMGMTFGANYSETPKHKHSVKN